MTGTFPFDPLRSELTKRATRMVSRGQIDPNAKPESDRSLAVVLGISHQTIRAIGKGRPGKGAPAGHLTLDEADEWCCRLGIHPIEVWGRLWERGGVMAAGPAETLTLFEVAA